MTLAVPLEYAARRVRRGSQRPPQWEMYRGGIYLGDIVRYQDDTWGWEPNDGDPVTVNDADEAIRAMLGTLPNEHEVPSSGD